MFLIIGTKFFTWGSKQTDSMVRCPQCGALAQFTEKTGMNFITIFFVVPLIPISGTKKLIQCPNCKARYQTT